MAAAGVAWIVDGIRTPIGRYGGALATVGPDDPGAIPVGKRALATMCIGVGQGIALAIESA